MRVTVVLLAKRTIKAVMQGFEPPLIRGVIRPALPNAFNLYARDVSKMSPGKLSIKEMAQRWKAESDEVRERYRTMRLELKQAKQHEQPNEKRSDCDRVPTQRFYARVPSPIALYARDLRSNRKMVDDSPPLSIPEVARRWRNESDEVRLEYRERSKKMYREVMSKLHQREMLADMPQLVEAERRRRICDEIRQRRAYSMQKLIAKYGLPRPPTQPFASFCAEYLRDLPNITTRRAAMKKAAEKWRKMTHDEKLPYLRAFWVEREQYPSLLRHWRDDMLREGNEMIVKDILRRKPSLQQKIETGFAMPAKNYKPLYCPAKEE